MAILEIPDVRWERWKSLVKVRGITIASPVGSVVYKALYGALIFRIPKKFSHLTPKKIMTIGVDIGLEVSRVFSNPDRRVREDKDFIYLFFFDFQK